MAPHNENAIREGPDRGSVVTYLDRSAGNRPTCFRLGIVVGPVTTDPGSADVWVGVRIPKANATTTVDLITTTSIVQIEKPEQPEPLS